MDLYQAVVLYNEGRLFEARRLCAGRRKFLRHFLSARAKRSFAICCWRGSRCEPANWQPRKRIACAHSIGSCNLEAPVLRYQAQFLMGQIQQASGDPAGAYDSCQKAREALETLRSSLRGDELKIAFMKNRLEVYESLVELCLLASDNRMPPKNRSAISRWPNPAASRNC